MLDGLFIKLDAIQGKAAGGFMANVFEGIERVAKKDEIDRSFDPFIHE